MKRIIVISVGVFLVVSSWIGLFSSRDIASHMAIRAVWAHNYGYAIETTLLHNVGFALSFLIGAALRLKWMKIIALISILVTTFLLFAA